LILKLCGQSAVAREGKKRAITAKRELEKEKQRVMKKLRMGAEARQPPPTRVQLPDDYDKQFDEDENLPKKKSKVLALRLFLAHDLGTASGRNA
jgi:hypothetical protein